MPKSASPSASLYWRLLSYAFRYKLFFIFSVIGFVLYASAQALLVVTIELFVNQLEGKATEWVDFLPESLVNSVLLLPIIVIIVSIARGLGNFMGNYNISLVGLHVVNTLRKEVFSHLLYLPQIVFDKSSSGEQISLVIYNIEQVSASVTRAVKTVFEEGFTLIALFIFLLWKNWLLTLVFFAVAPIMSLLVFVAARYFRRVSKKIQQSVGKISQVTSEAVRSISIVKSYTAEKHEISRFEQAADDNLSFSQKFERVKAIQTPILHTVIAISLAVIFLIVLLIWPTGEAGSAVAYVTAAAALGKPIKQLSTVNSIIQRGLAAAESIFEAIDANEEEDHGTKKLRSVRGEISIKNASFYYEQEKPALSNINLDIQAGQTVALVGQSGSGKTTLANIIMRFYELDEGEVFIDDIPLNDISLRSLRDNISLVSQHAVVFDTSIEANVGYGSENIDREKVIHALKNANAYDFVMELEQGLETNVGESGSLLSGGQRQRIAIARALYKDAKILILDEATSALDNQSEKLIQSALDTLMKNRTTIVIAHRLSTIQNADKIVVLDQGEIVESGTHKELLAKSGAYSALYHSQVVAD